MKKLLIKNFISLLIFMALGGIQTANAQYTNDTVVMTPGITQEQAYIYSQYGNPYPYNAPVIMSPGNSTNGNYNYQTYPRLTVYNTGGTQPVIVQTQTAGTQQQVSGTNETASTKKTVTNKITNPFNTLSLNASTNFTSDKIEICIDEKVEYTVNYANKTNKVITDATIRVYLPEEIDFVGVTADGNFNQSTRTLTVRVGDMGVGAKGVIYISGIANRKAYNQDNISTRVDFTFTNGSGVIETVTSYTTHSAKNCPSTLGAFALGTGFFPQSFLGWVILIVLLFTIIFITRRFFKREDHHVPHPIHQEH
jgi:hypothetical protein